AAGLAAFRRIPARRPGAPGRYRLRAHRQLCRRGPAGREPEGGPRGRHRVRDQPDAGRGALPPRGPLRWQPGRLPRRRRRQAHPAHPGGSMTSVTEWQERVSATDWDRVRADLDAYGCGLTGPLLTAEEAVQIAALYDDGSRFRSTINMARHRFGEGEYRYFAEPFPEAVTELKQALYPRLLPIARDLWRRLGRPAPWPDH